MKIVVVGYGKLFRSVIEGCLFSNHCVVGVLRANRVRYSRLTNFLGDNLFPDEDMIFVNNHKLYDINVSSVNSEKFRKLLVSLNPDIVLVSSWGEKFSLETIKIPRLGTINLHPALLPKYRGPNPYAQVIMHGENKTGLTFHLMDSNYDSGAILHQMEFDIAKNETGESLRNKCAFYTKDETIKLLKSFENDYITPIPQNEKHATYFHQLKLVDSILPFSKETSEELDRRIRALYPWLKCSIPCGSEFFMFKSYKIVDEQTMDCGKILYNDGKTVKISTIDGKAISFNDVYPLRWVPKSLHKKYVCHFLKTGSFVQ